jgi:hypothetical protein
MAVSKWIDQRDIPDGRWGKTKVPGCRCERSFTCGACLDRAIDRNIADSRATPGSDYGKKREKR